MQVVECVRILFLPCSKAYKLSTSSKIYGNERITEKSAPELQKLLLRIVRNFVHLISNYGRSFKNVRRIREVKRDIARIMLTLSKQ